MNKKDDSKITVIGVTKKGEKFRPSNWAERISGNLSTFKDHRIKYSPLLKPSLEKGQQCLLVDKSLQQQNPKLYQHILDFAKKNNLPICGGKPDTKDASASNE